MGKRPYFYRAKNGRGNTFRRPYPDDVQKKLGQREFKKSLGQGSHADVEQRYMAALNEWHHRVTEVRADRKLRRLSVDAWPSPGSNCRPLSDIGSPELQAIAVDWFVRTEFSEPPTLTSPYDKDDYVANLAAEQAGLARDDNTAMRTAARLLTAAGYDPQAGHPRLAELAALIHRGHHACLEYAASVVNGNLHNPISDPFYAAVLQREIHEGKNASVSSSRTFGDLVDLYIRGRQTAPIAAGTKAEERRHADILIEIIGRNQKLRDLDYETCLKAKELLLALPANRRTRYPGIAIAGVPVLARNDGIPPMTEKNANKYLMLLAAICEHGKSESVGWLRTNPAQALVMQIPKGEGQKYKTFTTDDLNAIFSAQLFRGCKDANEGYKTPGTTVPVDSGRYWVPLVGLYTGMRLNEVAQLEVADVEMIDGVDIIHVRKTGAGKKSVKTEAGIRKVPVHPELVRLGFMKLVARRKEKGCEKLFPDLPISKKGTAVDPFQKWYGRFLTDIKVKEAPRDGKSFHSFRHTARQALRDARVDREVVAALGGWKMRRDDMVAHYGTDFSLPRLFEEISKIAYPGLDLSHLYMSDES